MIGSHYNIRHVNLAVENFDYSSVSSGAYYFVFWYGDVPLGERYFQSLDSVSVAEFWQVCLDAIWPSLTFYHSINHINGQMQRASNPNYKSIKGVCELIFTTKEKSASNTLAISVIICTKDRAEDLKNCLECLQRQVVKPLEILVVDNASQTSATREVCERFNVDYVREDRVGLDIARNTGAKNAKGSIIVYTDDDTLPHPNWINEISKTFSNRSVDAMTGLVIAASLESEAEVIFEKYWPFNRGYLPKTYDRHFFSAHLKTGPPVWKIGAGANMAFRKETFEKVGYFDERLDAGAAGCNGDSEMWYRILEAGRTIQYNPLAVVQHKHRASMDALKKQLHSYMRGFTVAMLIQYVKFRHTGNLKHLFRVVPLYYLRLIRKGFPSYKFQYQTLFWELTGIVSGMIYFLRNRKVKA